MEIIKLSEIIYDGQNHIIKTNLDNYIILCQLKQIDGKNLYYIKIIRTRGNKVIADFNSLKSPTSLINRGSMIFIQKDSKCLYYNNFII